jgi:hypothetical protein
MKNKQVSFSTHEKMHCNIIGIPFTLVFGVFATESFKNTHLNWTMFSCPLGYPNSNARWGFFFLNPLNAELNPICHVLALLGAHHILHVRRIRVKFGP